MKLEKGKVYEIEYKDIDCGYIGLARCTSDEPMAQEGKLDLWMFDLLDKKADLSGRSLQLKMRREKRNQELGGSENDYTGTYVGIR